MAPSELPSGSGHQCWAAQQMLLKPACGISVAMILPIKGITPLGWAAHINGICGHAPVSSAAALDSLRFH